MSILQRKKMKIHNFENADIFETWFTVTSVQCFQNYIQLISIVYELCMTQQQIANK